MTPEPTPLVTVLPCDRLAAVECHTLMSVIKAEILAGKRDAHPWVQGMARHRLAALEAAAAKCLEVSAWIGAGAGSSIDSALQEAATAIRALSNKGGRDA